MRPNPTKKNPSAKFGTIGFVSIKYEKLWRCTLAGAYYDTFWSNIGAWNTDPHVSDLGVHVWEGKTSLSIGSTFYGNTSRQTTDFLSSSFKKLKGVFSGRSLRKFCRKSLHFILSCTKLRHSS